MLGGKMLARFHDGEAHAIELVQQVVGKFHVRLVDFVDQQHDALVGP